MCSVCAVVQCVVDFLAAVKSLLLVGVKPLAVVLVALLVVFHCGSCIPGIYNRWRYVRGVLLY